MSGPAPSCGDGVDCTDDSCDAASDQCIHIPNNAHCPDDSVFCNGPESCDAVSDCVSGPAPSCGDGVDCTDDSCDAASDQCIHIPNNAHCPDDSVFCNGPETCDAVSDCVSGPAPACDDGVPCTDDSCDAASDLCLNIPNDDNCPDDGLFCNGTKICDAVYNCQDVPPPDCDDQVDCTSDFCDEGSDQCASVPDDSYCDNEQYCDGVESCDAVSDCQPGTAVVCDDEIDCTDDTCNEGSDKCDYTPNSANCPDDGLFCTGTYICDAASDCQLQLPPCTVEYCDEESDICTGCSVSEDCDDGIFCNGSETCSAPDCVAGTTPDCDDGVDCTDDDCSSDTDACANSPNDDNCASGYYCDAVSDCTDVDECALGLDDCDPNATCTNTEGGFTCECDPGFVGNGESCRCDLTGYWAMRQDVSLSWAAVTFGPAVLLDAGNLDTTTWELHYYDYDGETLQVWKKGCGQDDYPDIRSTFWDDTYSSFVPLTVFDQVGLFPGSNVTGLYDVMPTDTFITPTEAAVVGVVMADPLDDSQWPASNDVAVWDDPDGDGEPGLSLWPRVTTDPTDIDPSRTYDYTPIEFNLFLAITERAGCVSGAARLKTHLDVTVNSCEYLTGDVISESSQARIHSCTVVPQSSWDTLDVECDASDWADAHSDGNMCNEAQVDFLDGQDQAQQSTATFELVWLGNGVNPVFDPDSPEYTCGQVRTLLPAIEH